MNQPHAGEREPMVLPAGAPAGSVLDEVRLEGSHPGDADGGPFALVSVPADDGELPSEVSGWVDADPGRGDSTAHWMSFQGTRVHWSAGRCAILAPVDRLQSVRGAVTETTRHELALRAIERALDASWPELESDAPLAFEFDESSVERRDELRGRLERVLLLRARLVRLAPVLLAPSPYPPTLASQVSERLRERLRMTARYEALSEQIDVFRETYEMCGQRASEFMLARTGHRLEWVIIVLLAAQLLLWMFEYLSAAGG